MNNPGLNSLSGLFPHHNLHTNLQFRMHICLTVDYSPWSSYSGGAQRSTHNLGMAMADRGHKVTVIYSKPPWENIEIPDDLPYEIRWANLIALKSRRAAFFRPLTTLNVNGILKKIIDPSEKTIVHSNGEEAGLVHRLRSKHTFGFICTPRHPHYPEVFFHHKKLSLLTKFITAFKEGKYLMQGSAAYHADFCAPPSQWATDIVSDAYNIPEERLRPVPNGVPREFLQYHRKPEAKDGPIVFFGRLSKTKGVDILVEALHSMENSNVPETWIIGRGEMKVWLQNKVAEYGLSEKVIFKPWMTHEELGEVLSQAKITVLPSLEENYSLAVLSSMCVGTPTISTNVGGTPEIIQHDKNGMLVEPDDPLSLASAILELISHPEKRERLGQSGAKLIRENLTWGHACEKFEQLYQQALDQASNRTT